MTEELDDLVRDALRAEVSHLAAPDDGLEALRSDLQHRPRRWRPARLTVAAAMLAVAAVASLLLVEVADRDSLTVIADGPSGTPPDAPTTTLEGDDAAVVPFEATGPRPEQLVGTTEAGQLVVVDVATGEKVRSLTEAGAESEYRGAESAPFIDAVEVSPDDATVYYSTCCEPVAGAMFRVPVDGSQGPVRLALDGAYPALRPGPDAEIVVANTRFLFGYDLPIGEFNGSDGTGSSATELADDGTRPFWLSPTSLVYQRFQPGDGFSIAVITGVGTESQTLTDLPTQSVSWEHPVGNSSAIIVADQCCAPEYGGSAVGRIVDPATGAIIDSFDLDGPVADLDLSNNWLLVTHVDGEVAVVDLSTDNPTPTPVTSGLTNAGWVPLPATDASARSPRVRTGAEQ